MYVHTCSKFVFLCVVCVCLHTCVCESVSLVSKILQAWSESNAYTHKHTHTHTKDMQMNRMRAHTWLRTEDTTIFDFFLWRRSKRYLHEQYTQNAVARRAAMKKKPMESYRSRCRHPALSNILLHQSCEKFSDVTSCCLHKLQPADFILFIHNETKRYPTIVRTFFWYFQRMYPSEIWSLS